MDECEIPFEQLRYIQYADLFPESIWNEKVNEVLQVIKEEQETSEDKNQNIPKNEMNETKMNKSVLARTPVAREFSWDDTNLKRPTVEEPEARMEDQSSITKSQGMGNNNLLNHDKRALNYSFVLGRNVDVSITLINHIVQVINSYIKENNSSEIIKSHDSPLFKEIRTELNNYHKYRCSSWLNRYKYSDVPPIYDEAIKKVMKDSGISASSISEIFEDLHKKIFDEYQKIEKIEDLDKFIEYCNNIIKPDLETLRDISDQMLLKEGIYL